MAIGTMDNGRSFLAIPITFVSGNPAVLSECKAASFLFVVSGPLPVFVFVCERVDRPLASDSGGYTLRSFCRYPKANEIARVFHRYHILVCDVWIPRAPPATGAGSWDCTSGA